MALPSVFLIAVYLFLALNPVHAAADKPDGFMSIPVGLASGTCGSSRRTQPSGSGEYAE